MCTSIKEKLEKYPLTRKECKTTSSLFETVYGTTYVRSSAKYSSHEWCCQLKNMYTEAILRFRDNSARVNRMEF
jgi:hypothetical protein